MSIQLKTNRSQIQAQTFPRRSSIAMSSAKLTVEDRVLLVKLYYSNGFSPKETIRKFKTTKNMKKDPFSLSTITKLVQKFNITGSVMDLPRSGRPSFDDEKVEEVQDVLNESKAKILWVTAPREW